MVYSSLNMFTFYTTPPAILKLLIVYYNFHVLTTNHITTKLTYQSQDQRHKYHHLTTTLHLTLKMTTAQVVETSVTNSSLSKDYLHPDDHAKQITDIYLFIYFIYLLH